MSIPIAMLDVKKLVTKRTVSSKFHEFIHSCLPSSGVVSFSDLISDGIGTYVKLIMVALWNRADHYIFILWFLSIFFFFFPRLISAAAHWMLL